MAEEKIIYRSPDEVFPYQDREDLSDAERNRSLGEMIRKHEGWLQRIYSRIDSIEDENIRVAVQKNIEYILTKRARGSLLGHEYINIIKASSNQEIKSQSMGIYNQHIKSSKDCLNLECIELERGPYRIGIKNRDLRFSVFYSVIIHSCLFEDVRLEGSYFARVYVFGSKIIRTNFKGCYFLELTTSNALFYDCKFQNAELSSGKFEETDFKKAKLDDSTVFQMRFHNSTFIDSVLNRIKIQYSSFIDCNCIASSMHFAKIYDSKNLMRVYFNQSSLHDADFQRSNFSSCYFPSITLTNATLKNNQFQDCDFNKASLHNTQLQGTTFAGGSIREADVKYAQLETAEFKDVDLSGCDFTGALFETLSISKETLERSQNIPNTQTAHNGFEVVDKEPGHPANRVALFLPEPPTASMQGKSLETVLDNIKSAKKYTGVYFTATVVALFNWLTQIGAIDEEKITALPFVGSFVALPPMLLFFTYCGFAALVLYFIKNNVQNAFNGARYLTKSSEIAAVGNNSWFLIKFDRKKKFNNAVIRNFLLSTGPVVSGFLLMSNIADFKGGIFAGIVLILFLLAFWGLVIFQAFKLAGETDKFQLPLLFDAREERAELEHEQAKRRLQRLEIEKLELEIRDKKKPKDADGQTGEDV